VEAGARPVELSDELATLRHSPWEDLPNGYAAHPKVDPATGCLHAIAYYWGLPHLQYVVVGPDCAVQQVEAVEVADGPMVHDCSITERWMVVYDLPVVFDLDGALAGATLPYRWAEGRAARVGLLPLHGRGDEVRWFEVAPSYVFHPVNAFDDGDRVVLDVVRYERMFSDHLLGPDDGTPLLWRWTIDTVTGAVTEEQLSDLPMEFPRVDERVVGRPHRWAYASTVGSSEQENDFGGHLVRVDAKSGEATPIDLGPGRVGGEWVHVPRHADAAEDDGWLLSLVHDGPSGRGELVVLAAADPAGDPVARVLLPNRVPLGFHGNWVPDPA
jgi:carotenoid cleavage dioxygenase